MKVNSIILATKMVQVTSEAKARPIITALTMMSADMNIDQGDNSRIPAAGFSSLLSPSAGVAAGVAADGPAVAGACAGVAPEGAVIAGGAACNAGTAGGVPKTEGSCAAGRCWAMAAEATAIIVNAVSD